MRLVTNLFVLFPALILLAGCEPDARRPGTFAVSFSFESQRPTSSLWAYARVEKPVDNGYVQVAEAETQRFSEDVQLSFERVPHGGDYVVVVELNDAPTRTARTVFFGRSQPFSLRPGKHADVRVALGLLATPRPSDTGPSLRVVETNEAGLTPTARVTLALFAEGATRAVVANDFALWAGRREVSLGELEPPDEAWLVRDWNLDAGRCAQPPCPDGPRSVYVQFLNDQGYASEVVDAEVDVDRVAPTLASVSLAPDLARAGGLVTLLLNPSEPLASVPRLVVSPADPGFSPFRALSSGGYVAELTPRGSELPREQFHFEVSLRDFAGHVSTISLQETLLIDARAPELSWGAEVRPPVVRDGETYVVSFELDEVVSTPPLVRVGGTPLGCSFEGPSLRRVRCEHQASRREGSGERRIQIEARDGAGNVAVLEAGTVLYDTAPRCGDGIVDVDRLEKCDEGDDNSSAPDASCRRDCLPRRCGDGVTDPGSDEVCDDGNLLAGDGCSSDCSSDESCPNGILDRDVGELCDDGNFLDQDGCSSRCRPTIGTWTRHPEHAEYWSQVPAVYDVAARRTLVFEGDLAAWDGKAWAVLSADGTFGPTRRDRHAFAYDVARDRAVLFGGIDPPEAGFEQRPVRGDTWEWDGQMWHQRITGSSPAPRFAAAFAHDPSHRTTVLFGGVSETGELLGDTWEWDGQDWTPFEGLPEAPMPRALGAMAFDPTRGRLVLFGGTSSLQGYEQHVSGDEPGEEPEPATFFDDAWEWDRGQWRALAVTEPRPTARAGHAMVFDPRQQAVLVVGGVQLDGAPTNEIWRLSGEQFSREEASRLPPRSEHGLTYELHRGALVVVGGLPYSVTRDPSNWERRGPLFAQQLSALDEPPSTRRAAAVTYEPHRGRTVVFGGVAATSTQASSSAPRYLGQTWVWQHDTFRALTGARAEPSPRAHAAFAHDPVRHISVLFGGEAAAPQPCADGCEDGTELTDAWVFEDDTWRPLPAVEGPEAPAGYAEMFFDQAQQKLTLVTSRRALGTSTHHYESGKFRRVSNVGPPPRRDYAVAYDPIRSRAVLFGGQSLSDSPARLSDTWNWDGTSWQLRRPAHAPSARDGHALAYDPTRGTVVLSGGLSDQGHERALWDWDGSDWTARPLVSGQPAARSGHAMVFESHAVRLLVVGGDTGQSAEGSTSSGTFTLQTTAVKEVCEPGVDQDADGLSACDDPDCYGRCTPLCLPWLMSCEAAAALCGDGRCDDVESCVSCAADCTCEPLCGDLACDETENQQTCPGDCST